MAAAVDAAERGDVESADGMSRRDFLAVIIASAGAAALGGFVGFGIGAATKGDEEITVIRPAADGVEEMLVFYPRLKVASLSELQTGQPVAFEYPLVGQPAQLIKLGKPAQFGLGPDEDIVAFSTKCTHMGWPLDATFDPDKCIFGPCPGHYSTFDLTAGGQVALGQATTRLPQVVLAIEGDDIYAEGMLGLIYGYRDNLLDGTPVEVTG